MRPVRHTGLSKMQVHVGSSPAHLAAHGPALDRHVVHLQRRTSQRRRLTTSTLIYLQTWRHVVANWLYVHGCPGVLSDPGRRAACLP